MNILIKMKIVAVFATALTVAMSVLYVAMVVGLIQNSLVQTTLRSPWTFGAYLLTEFLLVIVVESLKCGHVTGKTGLTVNQAA